MRKSSARPRQFLNRRGAKLRLPHVLSVACCLCLLAVPQGWAGESARAAADWSTPVAELAAASEAGDASATCLLGLRKLYGLGVPVALAEGRALLERAAEAGCADAWNWLGEVQYQGIGVPVDRPKALALYERGSEAGSLLGTCNAGLCLRFGDCGRLDRDRGLELLRKASEAGLGEASSALADETKVPGVQRLLCKKAEAELAPRAEAGDPFAADALGDLLLNTEGMKPSPEAGVRWMKRAAEAGLADAMMELGEFFGEPDGDGSEPDKKQSLEWFARHVSARTPAATQGDACAMVALGLAALGGEGVAEDDATALRWFRRAAKAGHPAACYCLGMCHEHGFGVPESAGEAIVWYRKGAETDDADSMFELGRLLTEGAKPASPEFAEGKRWLGKAAERGNEEAEELLKSL